MNITVNTKELLNGLNKLSKVISSKTLVPILSGVKLVAKGDTLQLIGSSYNFTGIITIQDIAVLEEGIHVIDFKNLHSFIKKSKADNITISKAEDKIMITGGKINLKANGFDSNEYPLLPQLEYDVITLSNEDFTKAMNSTIYAASKSESRPVLQGINITVIDNKIKFVATDSHRLGVYETNINQNIEHIEITPVAAYLDKVLKMIDKTNKEVLLKLNDQFTVLEFDNVEVFIKNIEGNYPDISRLIPDNFKTELEFDVKELLEALPQLDIFTKNSRNNVMTLNYDEKVVISSQNDAKDEINAAINTFDHFGEYLKLSFSLNYFMDSLKTLNSDKVRVKLTGAMRPFIIQADNNSKHLILPVRTY